MTTAVWCKDCLAAGDPYTLRPPRPLVEKSGGRCATHWRVEKRRRKAANHERTVQKTYGLGEGDYDRLYVAQGGVCAICRRATGASRRLSVDHDHKTGAVRGLLCRTCNNMLGHARDTDTLLYRAIEYLSHPPAFDVLGTPPPPPVR